MLMCRCCNCREIFDPDEIVFYREDYGEVFSACPVCGCDYEEIYYCDVCQVVMEYDEELDAWVCPECGEVEH